MFIFFFNDTATTEIYTLSLHDALPIWRAVAHGGRIPGRGGGVCRRECAAGTGGRQAPEAFRGPAAVREGGDRKSTRLNSSHANISYAVFCLKKKKESRE